MICLRCMRIMFSPDKKKARMVRVKFKEPIKWKNDWDEINIYSPEAWRKYLSDDFRLPNGRKLPDVSEHGEPLVYNVFAYGTSCEMREYFNKNSGLIWLFPGHDESGERHDLMEHGWLRKKPW